MNGHLAVLRSNSRIFKDTQLARNCVTERLRQIVDIENSLKYIYPRITCHFRQLPASPKWTALTVGRHTVESHGSQQRADGSRLASRRFSRSIDAEVVSQVARSITPHSQLQCRRHWPRTTSARLVTAAAEPPIKASVYSKIFIWRDASPTSPD
jgi:hypothetical protein